METGVGGFNLVWTYLRSILLWNCCTWRICCGCGGRTRRSSGPLPQPTVLAGKTCWASMLSSKISWA